MFENELLLVAGLEHHRVLIERSDTARQFHTADQLDRNIVPFLSCRVEEGILNVLLCRLGFHMPISFFFGFELRRERLGIGGSSVPVGSYNTALPRAFQLAALLYFRGTSGSGRALRPLAYFSKIDSVSFPSSAIYNRQFQTECRTSAE